MRLFLAIAFAAIALNEASPVVAEEANPAAFDLTTVKRGRQFYTIHCVSCHGVDGRGDTEMREFLKTPPADLTDGQWTYGGADINVFDVVKRGRAERDMPGFADKLNDERIWQVLRYMEYLSLEAGIPVLIRIATTSCSSATGQEEDS